MQTFANNFFLQAALRDTKIQSKFIPVIEIIKLWQQSTIDQFQ